MKNLWIDLRFGLRMFTKYPGFSILSVLAVALGMNLATSQLAVIDAFLFRDLPLPDSGSLHEIRRKGGEEKKNDHTFRQDELAKLAAADGGFEWIGGFYEGTIAISDGKNPRRYDGAFISWDFLGALKIQPELGRGFTREDDSPNAPAVVLISHDVWKRDFGGDRAIVGRTVVINSRPGSIIGVMPPGIHFPRRDEAWIPHRSMPRTATGDEYTMRAFGRLRAEVEPEAARASLESTIAPVVTSAPESSPEFTGIDIRPFHRAFLEGDSAMVLWIMLLAVFLVLLIACANVANLLLARSTTRGRELAVRSAVGATRFRLIRQMLVESFVLCFVGGAIGVVSTVWTIDLIARALATLDLPYWVTLELNGGVLVAVLVVTSVCALLAGVFPAIQSSRVDVVDLLKETGRTSTNLHVGWFGRSLIAVHVAMSFALLILSGLMIKTLATQRHVSVPFDPAEIYAARFGLFEAAFPKREDRLLFLEGLVERLEKDPLVTHAAVTTRREFMPALVGHATVPGGATAEGITDDLTIIETVSSNYFDVLGVPLRSGRVFSPEEVREERRVAIVNASFARRFFGRTDPVGRTVSLKDKESAIFTIIGLAPDMRMNGVGTDIREEAGVYVPLRTTGERFFTVIARGTDSASRLPAVVRSAVAFGDPNIPLYWTRTYAESIAEAIASHSIVPVMFLVFGGVAVFLAAIGIYGVVSFTVNQRTPEIGIRLALGARGGTIISMILVQGAAQVCGGLLAGSILALTLGSLVRRFIVGIEAQDIATFVAVGAITAVVALAASLMPARRAVRLTPLAALRHE